MSEITRLMLLIVRVGVDLAKNLIQVHAVDAAGKRVVTKALKRDQFFAWCEQLPKGCVVAMEACSSAHHWARRLQALGLDARLIAANFVTPYRMEGKSGKNDATDAAAICEAASRPSMRFVPIKTPDQQGIMSLHRIREGFKEERTACINRIRGVLAEFGLVFNKSPKALRAELADVLEDASNELSYTARLVLQEAFEHWRGLDDKLVWCDQQIGRHVRSSPEARQAAKITGIGELTASAMTASVGDFTQFNSGAQLGAWLGLVPSQNSSGGKTSLGRITKRSPCRGRQIGTDERAQARRPELEMAGATQGSRRLAEGLCSHGQQERAHPVGGDDARDDLRPQACQRQAAVQAAAGQACGCCVAGDGAVPGLTNPINPQPITNAPSTIDVLSKMH
jgi:transposase